MGCCAHRLPSWAPYLSVTSPRLASPATPDTHAHRLDITPRPDGEYPVRVSTVASMADPHPGAAELDTDPAQGCLLDRCSSAIHARHRRHPRGPSTTCSPGTPATAAWAMPCSSGRSAPCAAQPEHAPTTGLRERGVGHQAALRQLANRWVGILHGCLRYRTFYDENTAWQHHLNTAACHNQNLGCLPRLAQNRPAPSAGSEQVTGPGTTHGG